MISAVFPSPQGQQPMFECSLSLKRAAQVVSQVAIRILFIGASILMASAILPLSFHAIALPVVGLGSTLLSSFFFLSPNPIAQACNRRCPLLSSVCEESVLPAGAPKGLHNASQNCAFNSLVHFLQGDPLISLWLRNPVSEMNLEDFTAFLNGYRLPDGLIDAFRQHLEEPRDEPEEGEGLPAPSIAEQFRLFLAEYHPAEEDRIQVENMQNTFGRILLVQCAFARFFQDYDAVDAAPNSQILREALSEASGYINRSPSFQVDAPEIMGVLLELLPDTQKLHIREEYQYDTSALPPLAGIEDNRTEREDRSGYIQLSINGHPNLQQMLEEHFRERVTIEKRSVNGNNLEYPTTIVRQFQQAPTALRIQIKRFQNIPSPQSWLNWIAPSWFPELPFRIEKVSTPIEVPEQLTILLADGSQRRYRLTSFVNHHGNNPGGGHYTAAEVANGHQYFINDTFVTLADSQGWVERARLAYLLCYVPVEDLPQG